MPVHHIKLHGALYHAVENNTSLARRYLVVVQRYWPSARVYALAGGRVHQIGRKVGVRVWGEAFADRRYARDGTLVPRNRPGAVLTSPEAVVKQVHGFLKAHTDVDTICIHSDTANALLLAAKVVEVVRCPR